MRNVRSALVAAVVGLSLTTACSFSSSRSWGSANTADANGQPGSTGKPAQRGSKGKPAQHSSKGKPAQKNPTPAVRPTPEAAPAPVPPPAAQPPVDNTLPPRVPRDPPARVPRDDSPSSGSTGNPGTTIAPAPREPTTRDLKAAPTP